MPTQTPSDKLRFILEGNRIAAYPASAALKPEPGRTAIWAFLVTVAILSLGLAYELISRKASPRAKKASVTQQLVVQGAKPPQPTFEPGQQPPKPAARPGEHIVKGGDTLGRIAIRYSCSLRDLADANGFSMSHLPTIRIGQRLNIPTPRPQQHPPSSQRYGQ